MRLANFIDECSRELPPEEIFRKFCSAANEYGFRTVALYPVTPAALQALGFAALDLMTSAEVPEDWAKHYVANDYLSCDPVLLRAPHMGEPLVWDRLFGDPTLTARQRRVMSEGRDAGLTNGVSIPVHRSRGETFMVTLANRDDAPKSQRELDTLQALTSHFVHSYRASVGTRTDEYLATGITDRERDCLTWTARGKSAWEIAKILDVSEHTVNFHLKSGMRKLGAVNRMQAVVTAMRLGLILP